jgi:hypothetical protein
MAKKSPLYIEVSEKKYDMFGVPSIRNRILAEFLKALGGINESVEPGTYIFSVHLNRRLRFVSDLRRV